MSFMVFMFALWFALLFYLFCSWCDFVVILVEKCCGEYSKIAKEYYIETKYRTFKNIFFVKVNLDLRVCDWSFLVFRVLRVYRIFCANLRAFQLFTSFSEAFVFCVVLFSLAEIVEIGRLCDLWSLKFQFFVYVFSKRKSVFLWNYFKEQKYSLAWILNVT